MDKASASIFRSHPNLYSFRKNFPSTELTLSRKNEFFDGIEKSVLTEIFIPDIPPKNIISPLRISCSKILTPGIKHLNEEILTLIFVNAQNPELRFTSKTFYELSKVPSLQADYVFQKFGTKHIFDPQNGIFIRPPFQFTEDLALLLLQRNPFLKGRDEEIFYYAIQNGWENVVSKILNTFTTIKKAQKASFTNITATERLKTNDPPNKTTLYPSVVVDINCNDGKPIKLAIENDRCAVVEQLLNAHKIVYSISSNKKDVYQYKTHETLDLTKIDGTNINDIIRNKKYHIFEILRASGLSLQPFGHLFSLFSGNNNFSAVKLFAENGFDIRSSGDQALSRASKGGYYKIVKHLVEHGANIQNENNLPLSWASFYGHFDVVKYLVENGADAHCRSGDILSYACDSGRIEIVEYLLGLGVEVESLNNKALVHACRNNNLNLVKLLVEHGANIHAQDDLCLVMASRNSFFDIIKYLVEHGANVHAQDDMPLKIACHNRRADIVKYLMQL